MAASENSILNALNAATSALIQLGVAIKLISDDLFGLQRETEAYHLHFDRHGAFEGISYRHDPKERYAADDDWCVNIRSHCEWLPKRVDELWKAYPKADHAIGTLPRPLVDRLNGFYSAPWIATVRRKCLDNVLKWPGEMHHQSSMASEKVSGTVKELLQKAANFDPHPTWAEYQRLLLEYGHDLVAVRDAIQPRESTAWHGMQTLTLKTAEEQLQAIEQPIVDELVTLDQVAPLSGLSKRTLERYLQDEELPEPDIRGGGGKANKWFWRNLRPALSKVAQRTLPDRFPGSRIV